MNASRTHSQYTLHETTKLRTVKQFTVPVAMAFGDRLPKQRCEGKEINRS